jgi:hypothetical protein
LVAPPITGQDRRRAISRNQGVAWKALISTYITAIPRSEKASAPVAQSIGGLPPRQTDTIAMMAKVGAAARLSHSAAPSIAVTNLA